jgi:predicted  nucleic acid-binding Zn-ribbon protein
MKKKFNTLNSEIEAHKGEIQKMFMEEKKLHSVIKSLEKDISGLKKEVSLICMCAYAIHTDLLL